MQDPYGGMDPSGVDEAIFHCEPVVPVQLAFD